MHQQCPNCNTTKTPVQELTREGIAKNLIAEVKKDLDMKFLLQEYTEIRKELSETESQLKKDVKEFAKKRVEELHLEDKRKYFISCISRITTHTKSIAKTKGPQYVASLVADRQYHWGGSYFERLIFGKQQARSNYRLKFPYLRMSLY
jgi:hypothetical protein